MGGTSSTVVRNGMNMSRVQIAQRVIQRREYAVRQQIEDDFSENEHQDEFKRVFGGSSTLMPQQMGLTDEQQNTLVGLALEVARDQTVREAVSNSPAFKKITVMLAQSHENQQNINEIESYFRDNNNNGNDDNNHHNYQNNNFTHENVSNNSQRVLFGAAVGAGLLSQQSSIENDTIEPVKLAESSNYIVEEQSDNDDDANPVPPTSTTTTTSTSINLPASEEIRNLDPTNPRDARLLNMRQKFQNQLIQLSQLFDGWLLNNRNMSASNVIDSMQKIVVIIAISYLSVVAVRRINPAITVTFITTVLKNSWNNVLGIFHSSPENSTNRRNNA